MQRSHQQQHEVQNDSNNVKSPCLSGADRDHKMATPLASQFSLQQPAHEYTRLIEAGQLTSQHLVTAFLDQIDRHNHNGSRVNAILSLCPRELALSQARLLDEERRQGKVRSDLHGMPIVLKDAIVTHPSLGMITSAGACAIASLKAQRNATIVDRVRF